MQAYRLVRRPAGPTEGNGPSAGSRAGAGRSATGGGGRAHRRSDARPGRPGHRQDLDLVEAVAARVAEGVDPERILVLTFSRRGAADLRHRIEARIAATGQRVLREPLVRTFPAYAFGLLRRAAAERGEPSPRLLTGPEQDLIIRELLDVVGAEPDGEPDDDPVGWPADLRPALGTRAFAAQLRDLLMRAGLGERLRPRRLAGRRPVPPAVRRRAGPARRGQPRLGRLRPGGAGPGRHRNAARRSGAAGRRATPAGARLRRRVGRHRPCAAGAAGHGGRRRPASGRLRRPRLLDVRLPGRRSRRRDVLSAPVPHRLRRAGRPGVAEHQLPRGRAAAGRHRWLAHALRAAHLLDGVPCRGWRCWSAPPPGNCRGCVGRCTRPACRPWCMARICRCTCNRRSRRCCSCCAARWSRSGSTRRPPWRCCTHRSVVPTRWPSDGCVRASPWRGVTVGPPGSWIIEALRRRAISPASPGRGGRP